MALPERANRCRQCNILVPRTASERLKEKSFCSGYCESNYKHKIYIQECREKDLKKSVENAVDSIIKDYSSF